MTDNEIIKALECCQDCNCKECPCCRVIDGGTYCTEIDEEEILDLIKRQKTEIDILIRKKESLRDEITELQAEVEKYKAEHKDFAKRLGNLATMEIMVFDRANELKAETIKEFKARLINNIDDGELYNSNDDYWMTIQHINAVAKEMAEQSVNYESSKITE